MEEVLFVFYRDGNPQGEQKVVTCSDETINDEFKTLMGDYEKQGYEVDYAMPIQTMLYNTSYMVSLKKKEAVNNG